MLSGYCQKLPIQKTYNMQQGRDNIAYNTANTLYKLP